MCPPESNIGTATVATPILNNPLTGPIYLVSYGNAAFPNTEIVLQGEGVTAVLDGQTDIKNGVTFSNFESVPDVPFTSFTASLPAGPHSVLGAFLPEVANNNLCGLSLSIPTRIVAQNGRQINQATPIHVTGCPGTVTVRARRLHRSKHQATLSLTIYTPTAGTLRLTGRGVHPLSRAVARERLQTVALHTTRHHRNVTTLTLTLTAGHHKQLTRIKARL
jgi:hypothetical protein